MTTNSKIEWTTHTWNPWQGCIKVSPGCKNCYMYRDQERYGRDPRDIHRSAPATFNAPLKWTEPARVFTCSWSDFFLPEANEWRAEAWDIIRHTPHLTYQVLTKRPENIAAALPVGWGNGWDNVQLGVSVETEKYLNRIDILATIPAKVRFVSYEPALGPVDFTRYVDVLDWIISGGESGYKPRPADLDWFRKVRDVCRDNDVAYFHKQNGGSRKIDGAWGGRLLDGETWNQFPGEPQP